LGTAGFAGSAGLAGSAGFAGSAGSAGSGYISSYTSSTRMPTIIPPISIQRPGRGDIPPNKKPTKPEPKNIVSVLIKIPIIFENKITIKTVKSKTK